MLRSIVHCPVTKLHLLMKYWKWCTKFTSLHQRSSDRGQKLADPGNQKQVKEIRTQDYNLSTYLGPHTLNMMSSVNC